MHYTIDKHTKKEKYLDSAGEPVIEKDSNGRAFAKIKSTPGFIVRADDVVVEFVETKAQAIKVIERERANPSVVPGEPLTIEQHKQRVRVVDGDGNPVLKNGAVQYENKRGFNLRAGDKIVLFSENRADCVKRIQQLTGISDPVAAEESVKPKKDVRREPKKRKPRG